MINPRPATIFYVLKMLYIFFPKIFTMYCKFGNFARVLFSLNLAYAKFRENEILAKWLCRLLI